MFRAGQPLGGNDVLLTSLRLDGCFFLVVRDSGLGVIGSGPADSSSVRRHHLTTNWWLAASQQFCYSVCLSGYSLLEAPFTSLLEHR